MEIKISITTEKVLTWLLLSLAFTPLVVTSFALFPFVIGKTVFIRLMVALFWLVLSITIFKVRHESRNYSSWLNFKFIKNPIFASLVIFMLLGLVSTIFASVPSRAFFGTIERGEGYIHLLFLSLFFIATLLVFKGKEWLNFFRLSVMTGIIIGGDAILDFLQTGLRPNGTFINNPAFISGYMLFVLFASFMIISSQDKRFWRWAGYVAILLSLVTLGVSNTRGTIIGLLAGLLAVAIYFVFLGGNNSIRVLRKNINLRRIGIYTIILAIASISLFVLTIQSPVWDRIPGFDRLSRISLEDNTVQSRLINTKVALISVKPSNSGFYRSLFGYGPENFNVAYNENMDPSIQRYEPLWFDRAHNKVLDVLVMHGLLGLIAYMSLWYFVILSAVKYALGTPTSVHGYGVSNTKLMVGASIMFFAVAYFVHNLFLFDQTVTYVPLFVSWGFAAYLYKKDFSVGSDATNEKKLSLLKLISPFVAVGLLVMVVMYSFLPLYQVSVFISGLKTESAIKLFDRIDAITEPYNFAQPEIRFRVMNVTSNFIDIEGALPLVDKALELEEEVLTRDILEPRYYQVVGFIYDTKGRLYNESDLYPIAEGHFRKAIELAPGRQEPMFLLAQNLINQGRLDEAAILTEEMLAFEPKSSSGQFFYSAVFAPLDFDGSYGTTETLTTLFTERVLAVDGEFFTLLDNKAFQFIRNSYNGYLKYYFEIRDAENFLAVMERAVAIEKLLEEAQGIQRDSGLIEVPSESRSSDLEAGIRVFKSGGWDVIRLQ